jgi:alpha-L-fucosidase
MKRRYFLKVAGLSFSAVATWSMGVKNREKPMQPIPAYLKGWEDIYKTDPHAAALKWFKDAKFGLFIHYGLYSQLARGEWVMQRENIHVAQYKKLKETFTAKDFDADFITDLACQAGMKYINIVTRHHDGFCLFETATSDYHSMNSLAGRDLVAELAGKCREKGLGLFFYYSHGADWQHPYFYPAKYNPTLMPTYDTPDPAHKWRGDGDFQIYLEYAHNQLRELLSNYGPIAGIWFDPLIGYYGRPDLFDMDYTYSIVRKLQPQALISFKQGVTGTEDFAAPERSGHSMEDIIRKRYGDKAGDIAAAAWKANKDKYNEICDTLQVNAWGYSKDTQHKTLEQVMQMLKNANEMNANLLLNTGPLPDGAIHPEDIDTLKKTGQAINIIKP